MTDMQTKYYQDLDRQIASLEALVRQRDQQILALTVAHATGDAQTIAELKEQRDSRFAALEVTERENRRLRTALEGIFDLSSRKSAFVTTLLQQIRDIARDVLKEDTNG